MFCEKESCWLEKLAPYSCHGYPALVWPAIVNVLTWWKNVIELWINHQRSNIFVLCCGNQLDHRYKIGQEFPQIRYFASLTWKRFGNLHVRSLVSVPPTFLKASNLADQESVWGQRRIRGASIIERICDIPVDVVEHVSLAFHWHRFVCFWILYNICRTHHGMSVPEGKYFYRKTWLRFGVNPHTVVKM